MRVGIRSQQSWPTLSLLDSRQAIFLTSRQSSHSHSRSWRSTLQKMPRAASPAATQRREQGGDETGGRRHAGLPHDGRP